MGRKRILHLIQREKITSQIIDNFSQLDSSENIFWIFSGDNYYYEGSAEKHLLSNSNINEVIRLESYDALVVHGLYPQFAKIICEIVIDIKIAWFVWGFDIYNRPKIRSSLLGDRTLTTISLKRRLFEFVKKNGFLRKIFYLSSSKIDSELYIERAYRRIDFFCSYIYEDYIFFNKNYNHNTKYLEVLFTSLDQYLGGTQSIKVGAEARDILIGNSNSRENNHLDVFFRLKNVENKEMRFYVPLSYGDDCVYKDFVLKDGKELLKEQFVPLLDFMEIQEYFNILKSCSAAIFYHYRQQAMGNIIALLFMGVRVYLSTRNPVYNFCLRNNLIVYDFDRDFQTFGNKIMIEDDVEHNRRILCDFFSQEHLNESLSNLIRSL